MISTDEFVEAFLEHHGVKGMHWGIRNDGTNSLARKAAIIAGKVAVAGTLVLIGTASLSLFISSGGAGFAAAVALGYGAIHHVLKKHGASSI